MAKTKTYYVPVKMTRDSRNADGKLDLTNMPENQPDKTYTMYSDYNTAVNKARTSPHYGLYGVEGVNFTAGQIPPAPDAIAIYQVHIPEDRMMDYRHAGGPFDKNSDDVIRGPVRAQDISQVESVLRADYLNPNDEFIACEHVFEGSRPLHLELQQAFNERMAEYDQFIEAAQKTGDRKRQQIDLSDPVTQRALQDTYGHDGFMNAPFDELDQVSQILRSELRLMTENTSLDMAIKAEQFHIAFNNNFDTLASQNPEMPSSELALNAMSQTIADFQKSAEASHDLREQSILGDMKQMNEHMFSIIEKHPQQDAGLTSAVMANFVQEQRSQLRWHENVDFEAVEKQTEATMDQIRDNDARGDNDDAGLLSDDDFDIGDD